MKTKAVSVLPKCDICGKDAEYDAPTTRGPWANLCQLHYQIHGVEGMGTKFKKRDPKDDNKNKKVVKAKILSSMEELCFDSVMEVECPSCGEGRSAEPDADYTFVCEGCGQKCKIVNPLF